MADILDRFSISHYEEQAITEAYAEVGIPADDPCTNCAMLCSRGVALAIGGDPDNRMRKEMSQLRDGCPIVAGDAVSLELWHTCYSSQAEELRVSPDRR